MSDPTTPPSDGTGNVPAGNDGGSYPLPAGQPPVPGTPAEYAPVPEPTPPSRSRGKRVLIIVASVVVALVVAALVRWGLAAAFDGPSKQDAIEKSVSQIKAQTSFPKKVDQVTTWTDVKAEDGAIHYIYTVSSGVEPSSLTEKAIRDLLLPTLCSTTSTRRILDDDIAMRYSYTITGSSETVETTFTKTDC